jgi:HWE histidine kinase
MDHTRAIQASASPRWNRDNCGGSNDRCATAGRSRLPGSTVPALLCRDRSVGEHSGGDGREIVVESRHVRVKYDGDLYALGTNRDITARKHAEEQVNLLIREINHRAKNMLSVVDSIAHQTSLSRHMPPQHLALSGTATCWPPGHRSTCRPSAGS